MTRCKYFEGQISDGVKTIHLCSLSIMLPSVPDALYSGRNATPRVPCFSQCTLSYMCLPSGAFRFGIVDLRARDVATYETCIDYRPPFSYCRSSRM